MAVVQYTGVVNQLRGKLNGSVFNKGRNSFTLQKKQQPPIGSRGNQDIIRARYSTIQRHWATLTPAQQNAWATCAVNNPTTDRFGNPTVLSGYNQFIKANLFRLSVGLAMLNDPFTSTDTLVQLTSPVITGLNVQSNEFGESIISGNFAAAGAGNIFRYAVLDVSLPTSTGVTVYHRNFRRVGSGVQGSFSTSFDFNTNLGSKYPAITPGQVLWFAYFVFGIRSGAVMPRQVFRVVVPVVEAILITSFTYNSGTNVIDITVAYDPASTGVPPFYTIRAYYMGNTPAPIPVEQMTNFRNTGIEVGLQSDNTDDLLQAVAPGNWLSLRIDLLFAQTGAPISTAYQTIQAS